MSGWGVQQQTQDTATMTSSTSKFKKGFVVFNKNKKDLAEVLVSALADLAPRAAAVGLIADAVKSSGNKLGQATTENERAKLLVYAIMSKLEMDNAADVMKNFLECLEEETLLHEFLSK